MFTNNREPAKIGRGSSIGSVGFGVPHGVGYTHRELDVGQGANVWAYTTLALPMYTPVGTGCGVRRNFDKTNSSGVMWQRQGISIQSLGSPGNITGGFYSQPLVNTDAPASPFKIGAFSPGEFQIPTG